MVRKEKTVLDALKEQGYTIDEENQKVTKKLGDDGIFYVSYEDATIYTTVYPIEYLTESLYSDYATISSIYPSGADVSNYSLTDKQIKEYAKGDLFIYNGLGNEKNIAKDLINRNDNFSEPSVPYQKKYLWKG